MAPVNRVVHYRVLRLFAALVAAGAALPAVAAIPADAFTNDKLTAADTQRLLYEELVKRGVSRELAAVLTIDTQVVRDEPDHLQIVQTMIGGLRRDVDIRLTPGPSRDGLRVPVALEDGEVALAERVTMMRNANGVSTSGTVYLPKADPSVALLEHWQRQRKSPWWLELLGLGTANAQAGVVGMAMSYGDSFVSAVGNAVGVPGMTVDSVVDVATRVANDPGVRDVQTVGDVFTDVTNAMQTATEGPKTLWQARGETAGSVLKVLKTGYKVYGTLKKDDARRAKLKALEDCANNPTSPTARRAQREDPNYRRATTDVIADARRNLTLNTGLSIVATLGNTGAGELLKRASGSGSAMAKGVSYLNKLEQKMLDHVADEYIMKDVGKGIVPCEPDCGPVYRPEPPAEELASYPPAEWSGSSTSDGLVCQAAPVSSSPAANFTPGPTPTPPPNPAAATCGVLTHASFTYRFERSGGGCAFGGCQYDLEQAQFAGSVPLTVNGTKGYLGSGTGQYSGFESHELKSSFACSSSTSRGTVDGKADLIVNVFASIDNDVTGGVDTSAMPRDTSVVEVMFESHNLHQDNHSQKGCDKPESWSNDEAAAGLGCYFYGADLHVPGFYTVYVNNDPSGGICTLQLSR